MGEGKKGFLIFKQTSMNDWLQEQKGIIPGQNTAYPYHQVLSFGLALIPFLFCAFMIVRFALDMPFWDEWGCVPLIEHSHNGTLSRSDLWAQLNEHRPVLMKLTISGLARLSGWDIRWESATSLGLATVIFFLWAIRIRKIFKSLHTSQPLWLLSLVSLFVFSMSQEANWFIGLGLNFFLNVLSVTASLFLLTDAKFRWSRFFGAVGCALAAVFTLVNGFITWGIGLLIILIQPEPCGKAKKIKIGIWLSSGISAAFVYFHNFQLQGNSVSLWAFASSPVRYLKYFLSYLSAPIFSFIIPLGQVTPFSRFPGSLLWIAAAAGFAGMAFVLYVSVILWRRSRNKFFVLLPFFGLSLYSILTAFITGVGRFYNHEDQALSSRYITFSTPLWVTFLICLCFISRQAVSNKQPKNHNLIFRCVLICLIIFTILTALYGSGTAVYRHIRLEDSRLKLLSQEDSRILERYEAFLRWLPKNQRKTLENSLKDDHVKRIFAEPEFTIYNKILKVHKLSLYRNRIP